jgi:hypothetical protein
VAVGDIAPAAFGRAFSRRGPITIRRAEPADEAGLRRLAALTSRAPLAGDVLLAEADGELVAAAAISTGEVQTDPFHPTQDVAALLGLRAEQLRPLAA